MKQNIRAWRSIVRDKERRTFCFPEGSCLEALLMKHTANGTNVLLFTENRFFRGILTVNKNPSEKLIAMSTRSFLSQVQVFFFSWLFLTVGSPVSDWPSSLERAMDIRNLRPKDGSSRSMKQFFGGGGFGGFGGYGGMCGCGGFGGFLFDLFLLEFNRFKFVDSVDYVAHHVEVAVVDVSSFISINNLTDLSCYRWWLWIPSSSMRMWLSRRMWRMWLVFNNFIQD